MPLDAILDNCTQADDGTLTAYVKIVDDTGAVIKSISVSGKDDAAIEAALRPRMKKIKDQYNAQQSFKAAAQQRLDALKTDLGFGGKPS